MSSKKRKRRGEFLQFCRYVRSLHTPQVRIAIVCDNFSPHLSTRKDKRAGGSGAAAGIAPLSPARASGPARPLFMDFAVVLPQVTGCPRPPCDYP